MRGYMPPYNGKEWYRSKMVWFNIFVTLQGWIPVLVELLSGVQAGTVSITYAVLNSTYGLVNIVLRVWFTDEPVGQ